MDFVLRLWQSVPLSLQSLLECAALFMPLALLFPGKRTQPLFHKGMIPDAIYWLASPLLYAPLNQLLGRGILLSAFGLGIFSASTLNQLSVGLSPLKDLPILAQSLLILFIMDFMQYWTHRLFHGRRLWKFHAIHHSALQVDWLTSARFHPVNILVHSSCVYFLVYMLGFSPAAWAALTIFNTLYSPLVHANLSWTYGPLRYVLASPVFHRWHHTYPQEGGDKNFAPTFPFLDVLFGTYYDPKDARPEVFGAPYDSISDGNILQQLIYPFLPTRKEKTSDETL